MLSPEPRSFQSREANVDVDPIDEARPTLKGVAIGVNQLHRCHEATRGEVDRIVKALGLDPHQKAVAGLSTPRKAFIRTMFATGSAIGGAFVLYRVAAFCWPYVWAFLKALSAAILAGKL